MSLSAEGSGDVNKRRLLQQHEQGSRCSELSPKHCPTGDGEFRILVVLQAEQGSLELCLT